jgi:hypothetical protein
MSILWFREAIVNVCVYENHALVPPDETAIRPLKLLTSPLRSVKNGAAPDIEWVAQVSLLRPGFLLYPQNPGLKSETWATHSIVRPRQFHHLGWAEGPWTPLSKTFPGRSLL